MAQLLKNQSANAGDARDVCLATRSGDPLEKEMATCSNSVAWKISWTEEPGEL